MRSAHSIKAVIVCCGTFVSCVAFAADMPIPAPSPYDPPSPARWTGFYVGVGGGASSLNNNINAIPGPSSNSPGITAALNGLGANGWLATFNAGYDYQVSPSVVVGIFGDYDFHRLKSELDLTVSSAPFSVHGDISMKEQWSIGGRVSYLTSPATLIYLSGGYARLGLNDFKVTVWADPTTMISATALVPTISTGFVGAGVETKLTNSISLRAEYRYSGFGGGTVTLPTIDGTNLNDFVTARIEPTLQIVKASVNYRF